MKFKTLFLSGLVAVLLSSCGAGYQGYKSNLTNVELSQGNYIIEAEIQGEASSRFIFGIGRVKRLVSAARRDMLENYPFDGDAKALTHEVVELRSSYVAPFWFKVWVTTTAHVAVFTD